MFECFFTFRGKIHTSGLDCRESRTGMDTPGVPELFFFRDDVVSIWLGGKKRTLSRRKRGAKFIGTYAFHW